MRKINEIIIHCTATPEGKEFSVDKIRQWHLKRGFDDIGYHYVIHLDGSVELGRPIEVKGAHCQGHNARSVGIAYVGGMTADGKRAKNTLTAEQEASLILLCRQLAERHPEIMQADGKFNLHGHNEYANKRCPCFDVQEERVRWGL